MNKKLSTILFGVAFIALIIASVFLYDKYKDEYGPSPQLAEVDPVAKAEKEELTAPDFTVTDWDGEDVKLSDMFGKPLVINFWASWCPPCKVEMPDFDKVYKELGSDVTFMMVDLTDGNRETVEDGKKYVEDSGFSFPVYFDTNQEATYAYGVSSIPMTIFIDSEGEIVTYAQGAINESTLRKGVDMVANENGVAKYNKISADEAKDMMESNPDYILLDVRTEDEYAEAHIEGAILIPDYEIAKRAGKELTSKDKTILVYCRSGRRSENASKVLVDLGYTDVYDFGGILDWPYATVTK